MGRTSNDDRSNSMNINNSAYEDSLVNHGNQLNPEHEHYQGSSKDDDDEEQTVGTRERTNR